MTEKAFRKVLKSFGNGSNSNEYKLRKAIVAEVLAVCEKENFPVSPSGIMGWLSDEFYNDNIHLGMLTSYEAANKFFERHKWELNEIMSRMFAEGSPKQFYGKRWDTNDFLVLGDNNRFCVVEQVVHGICYDLIFLISQCLEKDNNA